MDTPVYNAQLLSQALKGAKCGTWDWRIAEGIASFGPNYYRIAGYEPDEFPPKFEEFEKRIHPDDLALVRKTFQQYLAGESDFYTVEFRFKTKPGEWMWILGQGEITERDENGQPTRFTGLHVDISQSKQAQLNFEQERAFSTSLIDTAQMIVLILDVEGRIRRINPYMAEITGYEEDAVKGKDWFDTFLPPADYAEIREVFKKAVDDIEVRGLINPIVAKDGRVLLIEWYNKTLKDVHGAVFGVLSLGVDITARKQAEAAQCNLEEQLQQKHKMEAVGYMAGGMAHNFNNNLSIILGNIELAQMKEHNSEVIPLLKNAKIGALRSRDLVKKIMSYSRKAALKKEPIECTEVISETIALLKSTLPTTVNLSFEVKPGRIRTVVNADSSQIQEVLINLCNNAVHAMDEKGELKIMLDNVELSATDVPAQFEASPGFYAKLSVQDSGCGIAAEVLDKIFDPFFTTKEEYEGAGMGLATVQGIVAQHGGVIKVNSILGQGTVFDLYLPLVDKTATAAKTTNNLLLKGTEKILFVDDDPIIADLGEQLLTAMGYQVTTMTNSVEALKLFSANVEHYDLVITDQTMPNITGEELIREIKNIRPNIPTILSTGYSSKIDENKAKRLGISAFCLKPFDLPELLQTVRRVLGEDKN